MTFDPFTGDGYVELFHIRDHAYVKPPGSKAKYPRCHVCGRGKWTLPHLGCPRSINVSSSRGYEAFMGAMKLWVPRYVELLADTALPRPCGSIKVEGLICFPDRKERDQGNFRGPIEKALGDALQTRMGDDNVPWLVNDNWSRFEFGDLRRHYQKDVSYTLLRLYPFDAELPEQALDFNPPVIEQTELAV